MTTEEFIQLVLPSKDKLFRLAKRILTDVREAEDIVQEVLYRLWAKKDELSQYRSIEAFAMVVTKNMCIDKLRSNHFDKTEIGELNAPVEHYTPERIAEQQDGINLIHSIIQRLPEQQRIIIQLRDIEELEFEEIGEVMHMNLNAVRVNLSRARKTIREQLIKHEDYEYRRN